ncbi:MAG: hypothetical protein HEQ23_01875 [Tepidisphaera sp.]
MDAVLAVKPFVKRRPWSVVLLSLALLVVIVAAVQTVITLAGSFDLGFGFILVLPRILELGLIAFGLVLTAKGMPYRMGGSLHCSRCGYQRVEERDRLLVNCPECGHYWRLFGGWRTGKPLGDRRLVTIGLLLCVVGIGTVTGRELAARWLTERLSSSMLIRHVLYAPAGSAGTSWEVLARRPLTQGQARWLADDLLKRRSQRGSLDLAATLWLQSRVSEPGFDKQLVSRYYEELADFWIEAPSQAQVQQAFEVSVRGVYRGNSAPTPEGRVSFAVEGIVIELPAPPQEDLRTEFEKQFLTGPKVMLSQGVSMQTLDPASAGRDASLASASGVGAFVGKATVRATVWILIGPEVNEELRWTTGSGPQSLSTQRRAIRRDIVREVDIVPGGR